MNNLEIRYLPVSQKSNISKLYLSHVLTTKKLSYDADILNYITFTMRLVLHQLRLFRNYTHR